MVIWTLLHPSGAGGAHCLSSQADTGPNSSSWAGTGLLVAFTLNPGEKILKDQREQVYAPVYVTAPPE